MPRLCTRGNVHAQGLKIGREKMVHLLVHMHCRTWIDLWGA